MSQKIRIGLLTPFFKPIPGYELASNDLNLDLAIVTPSKILWREKSVQAILWNGQHWLEQAIALPRAFYNRYYGPKPQVIEKLEAIIGHNKVFNHITRFNKWDVHQILGRSSLKPLLPATIPYNQDNLFSYLKQFKQVVLKPSEGQLGNNIYLISKEGPKYVLHHSSKYPIATFQSKKELLNKLESVLSSKFLIQQFIPLATLQDRVFDLRCLVQKDGQGVWRVSGRLSRRALRYSYITNLSQAITNVESVLEQVFPDSPLLPTMDQLSIKGAQIAEQSLGSLGELSVDFGLEPNGRIWIIELNAKPMKNIFGALGDPKLLQEIYQLPLLYARHLATI